jgi:ribosomal protein L11 methyltransferase
MKHAPLWKVSIRVTAEAEEIATALLEKCFGQPASVYVDARTGWRTASVYLGRRPTGRDAARRAWREMTQGVNRGKPPALALRVERLPAENWADSWKRHFQPFTVGAALLIKPSWSRRRPRRGQAALVLDPGLSFGTGRHPTTRFCLEQLAEDCGRRPGGSFLDAGTGSGILAIAAAKLGYRRIEALDFDPDAVRVARANARANGVARRIRFSRADLTKLPARAPRQFDLVCANLTHDLLLAEQRRLLARLAPGGRLVLAGVLRSQFPAVRRAYRAAGMRLAAQARMGEWHSAAFTRTGADIASGGVR